MNTVEKLKEIFIQQRELGNPLVSIYWGGTTLDDDENEVEDGGSIGYAYLAGKSDAEIEQQAQHLAELLKFHHAEEVSVVFSHNPEIKKVRFTLK
jgi:hypothetical protein